MIAKEAHQTVPQASQIKVPIKSARTKSEKRKNEIWLNQFLFLLYLTEPGKIFKKTSAEDAYIKKPPPIEHYLARVNKLPLPGIEALKRHLREKYRRNCKPATLNHTIVNMKIFLSFFQERGKSQVEELTREDINAFIEHEQDRGLKPASVRTRIAIIRAFVRFLVNEDMVDPRIILRPIRLKLPDNLPRAMAPEDVKQLVSVLDNVRERALILVLLRTGMRIGELLATKVQDVHMEQRRIDIPQASKNATGRVVYLSDDACQALADWLDKRDADKVMLFYSMGRHVMGYATARLLFQKHIKKAGLKEKGYSLHSLRHTFASEMLNAGMRIECVQQLLGHSNLEVTRRYARLTNVTREKEFFKAMEIIENGGVHGHYQLDPELQEMLEKKKLQFLHII